MKRLRAPLLVLVLGCFSIAVGVWIFAHDVNHWILVFGQFGFVYLVVGVTAIVERTRSELSFRSLSLVCSLPGVSTALVLLVTEAPLDEMYPPHHGSLLSIPLWLLAVFGVQWVYVLGRTSRPDRQWTLVGIIGLLVAISPTYHAVSHPFLYLASSSMSTIIGIGFWTALLPYWLGKSGPSDSVESDLILHPPAVLAVIVGLVLFTTLAASGQLDPDLPNRPGVVLLMIILYGPFLYLAARAISIVANRPSAFLDPR